MRRVGVTAIHLSLVVTLVVTLGAAMAADVGAQSPDTTQRRDTTARRLAPIAVRASIAPTAGPAIGSTIPARVSVLPRRELDEWQPRTLADALGTQPGVSVHDDLGSPYKLNVSLRGFTVGPTVGLPPGISVFLDGVRQNEPDAQEVNFDLLPMAHVERVELLSGPASLLGPNSLGGAVNLVTRRGSGPPAGALELSVATYGGAAAEASAAGSTSAGWDYYAAGGYEREGGWRQATGAANSSGFVNLGRRGAARGMSIQAFAARSRAETAGSLPESVFDRSPRTNFTLGDFERLDAQQLSVSGYAPLARGHGSFTAFARRSGAERFNVNQPPDDDVRSRTANLTAGINADWRWSTLAGNSLLAVRAGLDGSGNRVHARIFVVPQTVVDPADSLTTDVRSPGWNVAGYTIADMRMGRFTLSAGGRYDYVRIPFRDALDPAADTASTYWRFSPRGGISVDAGAGRSLYASVGQSFRAPAILELACADPDDSCPLPFALGDDPPLAPVRATTYELGGTWTRGGAGASASVYRTDVRDEILFVASDQARLSGYFTNLARTRREGAELSARFERPDGVAAGYASYTYTRATFQRAAELFSMRSDARFAESTLAGPNEVASGDRLPLLPDHLIKAGASLRLPGGADVGLDARYVGRQWLRGDEANETSRLDPYVVTNARVGVARSAWDVALLVTNLLDSRRATFGTFNENRRTGELERFLTPLSGRTVRVTVRRRFGADSMREPN